MDAVVTARATSGTVITEAHVSATVAIPDGWLGVPAPRRGVAAIVAARPEDAVVLLAT